MGEEIKKIKVAHFISDSGSRDRQILYEFIAMALPAHTDSHYYILNGNNHFIHFLNKNKIDYTLLNFIPNSIFDTFKLAWKLRKDLSSTDVVHTHYYDANILGLLSGYFAGVDKRITTRHHNAFDMKAYPRKQVWVRKLINKLSTQIVAPSKSVRDTLVKREKVRENKIKIIYHPFDPTYITLPTTESIQGIREKYKIPDNQFIIGAVSSFYGIKGTLNILNAFIEFTAKYPNVLLILANAHGELEDQIQRTIKKNSLTNVCLIPYENEILSLYKTFDIIIHTPISEDSEAFGQVYIESMYMGVPGIFTQAGILKEIAIPNKNCVIVDYKNLPDVLDALELLYLNSNKLNTIGECAKKTIDERFSIKTYRSRILELYSRNR